MKNGKGTWGLASACLALACLLAAACGCAAATTARVSVASGGSQADGASVCPAISPDGRIVAFCSEAANLVSHDTNRNPDVFARDRLAAATSIVSVSTSGGQGSLDSNESAASSDGRFIAFCSMAGDLVSGDSNGQPDVFVRDRLTGATERVSVNAAGQQGDRMSGWFRVPSISISADGRFVAFSSFATNLVPGDANGHYDIFVRDRTAHTTERVSVSASGAEGNNESWCPSISADGRYVAFSSNASNLVTGDTNGKEDVFLRDRTAATTVRVSVSSSGAQGTGDSTQPSISADGQVVAFASAANNLVAADPGHQDVFLHDLDTGATECVSRSSTGQVGNAHSVWPSVSADGRFVAFSSSASNLVSADTNATSDVFLRDRSAATTQRISVSSAQDQAADWSDWPSISADGRFVAFRSFASNLVAGDTNAVADIFVRERGAAPPAISINSGASCTNDRAVALSIVCADWPEVRFRNDTGDWLAWEPCSAAKSWTLPSGDGLKRVCVEGRDVSLNQSGENCAEILLDATPPTGLVIAINGGADCADSSAVTLTLYATGAAQMRFRNESASWSSWEPVAASKSWNLSAARGLKTVAFQCRDSCGNESGETTDSIRIPAFADVGCAGAYFPHAEALAREGIASGCSPSPPLFCPLDSVTRAQMAKFLCLSAGKQPLDNPTPTFADAPKTYWAYGYIERLADPASWPGAPPTSGCRARGTIKYFCPLALVTRAQMAKLICLAAGKSPMPSCAGLFADVPAGDPFCAFIERLTDAASWGGTPVTSGCAPGPPALYCPGSNITRGQMSVFLVRAFTIPL